MDELVRRIAFDIQEDGMRRLDAQRIVAAVLAALIEGDQVGRTLVIRSNGSHRSRSHGPQFCSWD